MIGARSIKNAYYPESGATNDDELQACKQALRVAMRHFLTEEQLEVLRMHYEQNLSKTDIARHMDVGPSCICKRIKSAQQILREQIAYFMETYTLLKKERQEQEDAMLE